MIVRGMHWRQNEMGLAAWLLAVSRAWRRDRAVQSFAVHFCSLECKDQYLAELFQKPATLLEVEEVAVVPEARVLRARKKVVPIKATNKRSAIVTRSRKR